MTRSWFGGDSGSFVVKLYTLGSSKLMAIQDQPVEVWSDFAVNGGVKLTGLLDKSGAAVDVPNVTTSGQVEAFQGPDGVNDRVLATADHGVTGVWLLNTDGLPAADARDAAQAAANDAAASAPASVATPATSCTRTARSSGCGRPTTATASSSGPPRRVSGSTTPPRRSRC